MQIYLARNQVQAGPYSLDDFNNILANGEVVASDLMWHAPMPAWRTVGDVVVGGVYAPQSTQATPNRPLPTRRQTFAQVYKDAPTPSKPVVKIAPMSMRALAFAVNFLLLMLAFVPMISALMRLDRSLLSTTPNFNPQALQAHSQRVFSALGKDAHLVEQSMWFLLALIGVQLALLFIKKQSLGKMLIGLHIDASTTGALVKRAILIPLIYYVACMVNPLIALALLCINWFFAKDGKGWHDRFSGTQIVHTPKPYHKGDI